MKKFKLTLNEQEKKVLIELLNLAVKAGGLQVAESSSVLARKISQAEEVKEEPKPKEKGSK